MTGTVRRSLVLINGAGILTSYPFLGYVINRQDVDACEADQPGCSQSIVGYGGGS